MPAESQSRLAQSPHLLYYTTSYRCRYRHREEVEATSVLCCPPAPASLYLPPPKGQDRFHNLCNNTFRNPAGGDTQIRKLLGHFPIDFSSGRAGNPPLLTYRWGHGPLHLRIVQVFEGEGARVVTCVTLSFLCLAYLQPGCNAAVLQDCWSQQRFF